jgi:hypothetical protein
MAPWRPRRAPLLAVIALLAALGAAGPAGAQAPAMRAAPEAAPVAVRVEAPTAIELPVTLQRGRIRVRAEAGLDARAAAVAERADEVLAAIADDLRGLAVPAVVELRIVRDAADMSRAAPGGRVPPWAAGVAYPALGVVVVALWRGPSTLDLEGTVDHELAHLALGAALGDAAPRWLHEGFAYLHSTDVSWERSRTLAGMAWFGSTIDLDDLEHAFPAEELPASRAYAQSYDFVAFLARRGRWGEPGDRGDRFPFQRFLAEVAATRDVDAAAQRAFGRPIDQLFEEWRADLRGRFMFLPIGLALLAAWLAVVVLLVVAWRKRRRQNAQRLAEWDRQERAREEARAAEPPAPRLVPAVPVWAGPSWAPPGAPVSEPPQDELEVELEEDTDEGSPRPPPPPRRPPSPPN